MVTDGPFVEGKEVVSGFAEIEVEDLDAALRLAQDWPGCPVVEIRPIAARDHVTHELARVVRDHAGRLAAALVNLTGDFSTAEDLVQDAVEAALPTGPRGHPGSAGRAGCSPWPGAEGWTI